MTVRSATRRLVASAIVGVLAALGLGTQAEAAPPGATTTATTTAVAPGTRAMWLWTKADPTAVLTWATAHGVREIFVYVPPGRISKADLTRYRALSKGAATRGIRLAALGAETTWITNPSAAVAWQRTALGTGLFALAHVDVEPYLLPSWNTDRAGTVSAYLTLLRTLQDADSRALEADVPFWFSTVPAGSGNLADAVLARVSAVTVMTYRDTATGPNSLLDVGTDMLTRATTAGKPVRLAAETQPLADCPYCTFYEEGQAAMTSTLAAVDSVAAAYASFAGIAIHHYDSWRVLAP